MIIFYLIWSVWFLSEILLNRILRAGKSDKQGADKGSIRIIWITIGTANTVGIIAAVLLKFPISNLVWVPVAGLVLVVFGMIIRFVSIWTLGRYFTVDVTIRENHKIKQTGMYKIIRHPSYLGSLLSFIGFGISLNNWISVIVIMVLMSWAMLHRISIEEKVLIKQFGQEYLDYMKHTYRLIPWIY
jgi:protein-S-isoprenylcysteine O-methyltransferase Ste14